MGRDLVNYFDCVGTGADNITHGFNFCTAIDIGNHDMIGILGFETSKILRMTTIS